MILVKKLFIDLIGNIASFCIHTKTHNMLIISVNIFYLFVCEHFKYYFTVKLISVIVTQVCKLFSSMEMNSDIISEF